MKNITTDLIMSRPELNTLNNLLLDNTVLSQFMKPLQKVLDDLRHYHSLFPTLIMPIFCMLGCLRHLTATTTLRAQIQDLLHLTDESKLPLARSTWADALSSTNREDVLMLALPKLASLAQACLPDRLAEIHDLGNCSGTLNLATELEVISLSPSTR